MMPCSFFAHELDLPASQAKRSGKNGVAVLNKEGGTPGGTSATVGPIRPTYK
jgi:hypothetical protein